MHMKSLTIKFFLALGLLGFSAASVFAGDGKTEKTMMKREKVVLCGQQNINGFASKVYGTAKECTDDKKDLSKSAVKDGKDRCDAFCKGLECKAPDYPKSLAGTAACKVVGKKVYGTATTTKPILCKCKQ